MKSFTLHQSAHVTTTDVIIGDKFLVSDPFVKTCLTLQAPIAIITDTHVESRFGNELVAFLKHAGVNVQLFSFPAGEEYKTRETKAMLEDALLSQGFGRDCVIMGLGGGCATDLAGFVAATFTRGVPFYCIPTTLMGMVDASLGGKTGVNTPLGKNLIGAFYPPRQIFMDLATLKTLPEKEWRNGVAEVIKHGLIASPPLFSLMETNRQKWQARDFSFLSDMIFQSCQVKKEVVESDFKEASRREILNFGHTIGHALEALENYQISHGEAIAIGMAMEGWMSVKLGMLDQTIFDQMIHLFKQYGFTLRLPHSLDTDRLKQFMLKDKKVHQGQIRCILLKKIGEAVCKPISEQLIDEATAWHNSL
jgi:3-dehydroquinate synthase